MNNKFNHEKIFLHISFLSPEKNDTLKTIEIFGIPGEKARNGQCFVSQTNQEFFDDLIARQLFDRSRKMYKCDFEYLKIWLYDSETRNPQREYMVPTLDEGDLKISSNILASKLESIYVLDNGLKGREYLQWKQLCEELLAPLFSGFIAPPDVPVILSGSPLAKFFETLNNSMDKQAKMKQNLFFDSLIVQID